ncbi:hypothetical protein FOCC_FOCC015415 [Frankliniella occidentalis]|nr:hypothetical protein FOCC_FOCC015415 [Frankliniella occidentalis]
MVKSEYKLQEMDRECTDIFEPGLIEHYANRPDKLETLCLAQFAANYKYSNACGKNSMELKNKSGYITKCLHSKIIRYRNYHYEIDPENYLRENIMLYLPWRNEKAEILNVNLEDVFTKYKQRISDNKVEFNAFSDEALQLAFDEALTRTSDESEVQEKNTQPKFDFDDYSFDDEYTVADIQHEMKDDSQVEYVKFISPGKEDEDIYQKMFETLNQDQRDYIMHVADHFKKYRSKQLLHFLTGGAGVGKSLTIKTLYQTLNRLFNSSPNDNPDDIKILLCGPTGKASFNIGGQTIHSAFKLPLNTKTLNELSADVSNTLASKLKSLKVVIIDEISMVGQHTLQMIDQRLRHLFNTEELFGGISIITVGDFFQLRPVCATALYYPQTTNPYAEIFQKNLWHNFKVFQLTKIMRQNEKKFQVALNNLARGKLTKRDIQLFQSRTFKKLPRTIDFSKAIHLFGRNADVDMYNQQVMKKIDGEETICCASDVFHGHGSQLAKRQMEYNVAKSKTHQTMGLPQKITLKVGAIYMVTYNVDTEDGICNGATGTLKKITYGTNHKGEKKPLRVWIKFEDRKVGALLRNKFGEHMKNHKISSTWTPLDPISLTISTRKTSSLKINRKQFPLTLAHALTVHKSQGQSLQQVVVHLENRSMPRDQLYVACSRATTLSGLYIIGQFKPPKELQKKSFLSIEMRRWRSHILKPKFTSLQRTSKKLKIMYHNIQSLKKHKQLVRNDANYTCNDLLIFGETWAVPHDNIKIKGFKLLHQLTDSHIRKPQGVSVYVKKSLHQEIHYCEEIVCNEAPGKIQAIALQLHNTLVVGIYAKPKTSRSIWRKFYRMLPLTSQKDIVIVGDFNINSKRLCKRHFLLELLEIYKLKVNNIGITNTHAKTSLTWVISNKSVACGTYISFFSHHYPMWIKKAIAKIVENA